MKKDLSVNFEIPEGVTVEVNGNLVTVKGRDKETKKEIEFGKISNKIDGKNMVLTAKNGTKRESRMIGTIIAHINNMAQGIKEGFVYKMEICNVHFPMNVKVEGEKVVIKSFLGEKVDRIARILPNVKVSVKGSEIEITSPDVESAGQTAANIEKASRLKGRDRRIFQDGIFIKEKCGVAI